MQLGCPRCHERQTVAGSLLATGEARVRCSGCGIWFQVRVRGAVPGPPPMPAERAPAGRWSIRRRDETIIQFPSIRALHDYVVQGVVTIDDEISRGGKRWKPLRDVPELHGIFDVAEVRAVPVEVVPDEVIVAELDVEAEAVLMAEEVLESPLTEAPPLSSPAPPASRSQGGAAAPPSSAPPARSMRSADERSVDPELWLRRGIDDLGAADASDTDDPPEVLAAPRSVWGLVFVVLLLAVAAWTVWRFGFQGEAEPLQVRAGETLPPSGRSSLPELASTRASAATDASPPTEDATEAAPELLRLREPEEAVERPREVAALAPGRNEQAPAAGDHAAESLAPGYDALMRRGNELLATNPTAAIAQFQRAMALSSSVEPVAKIGWAYLNQGRSAEAITWFEKAMARSTRYASTYEGMGRALERAGRRADAVRYYEMYLENFPIGSQASRVRSALERLRGAQ